MYNGVMGRTNIVIDDKLVLKVMKLYGLPSKRAAVDFALRAVAGSDRRRDMLDMRGAGWEGDLDEMRAGREFDW